MRREVNIVQPAHDTYTCQNSISSMEHYHFILRLTRGATNQSVFPQKLLKKQHSASSQYIDSGISSWLDWSIEYEPNNCQSLAFNGQSRLKERRTRTPIMKIQRIERRFHQSLDCIQNKEEACLICGLPPPPPPFYLSIATSAKRIQIKGSGW